MSPPGTLGSDRTLASSLQLSYPAQRKQKGVREQGEKKSKCSSHQNKLIFTRLRGLSQSGMVQQRPGIVYAAWSWQTGTDRKIAFIFLKSSSLLLINVILILNI